MTSTAKETFQEKLKTDTRIVEARLDEILTVKKKPAEILRPPGLIEAMRYSVFNGGKRLRPFLVMESAALLEVDRAQSAHAAAAIECIHCYSLVHDDLPAMDDDDLRRGQPTTHKAFGEALAILAGDGLLTLAFEVLADPKTHPDPEIRSSLVLALAGASGLAGMVGGQHLDLAAEGATLRRNDIMRMQSLKTGALIKVACTMGGTLGNAATNEQAALAHYGQIIGQAFQLADDILDETATAETMGKATAKDRDRGKATLVAHLGLDQSITLAHKLVEEAKDNLSSFGAKADTLRQTADFVVQRMN